MKPRIGGVLFYVKVTLRELGQPQETMLVIPLMWITDRRKFVEGKNMATKQCPICGENSLDEMRGTYRFDPPPNIPGGTMVIVGDDLGTLLVVWRGHFVVGVGSGHRPGAVTAAEIGDIGTEHQDRC